MNYKEFLFGALPLAINMNSSEAESYKKEKEEFVSGFNGSSIEDVFTFSLILPVNFS